MAPDVVCGGTASRRLRNIGVGLLIGWGAALATVPALAAAFTDAQKAELGPVIRDYLVQNPEVLRDAMDALERKEKQTQELRQTQIVDKEAKDLFDSPFQATLGNPQGKATIVEFFDYNCGYCKRALDDMGRLLKTDPDVKIVLKDFPVLGPGSVEAAQVASAVRSQFRGDKFWAFHTKLLSMHGPIGKAQALAVAKELGADMQQIERELDSPDIKAGLQRNMQLADALSLTGTPSFIIGKDIVVGAVGYDELRGRLDNYAHCGKSICS